MSPDKSTMDRDAVWRAIDAHRLRMAELLDQLTDDEWGQPSLCAGWTVRDVAAHLTLQQVGVRDLPAMFPVLVRARGNTDKLIDLAARRQAARLSNAEMIAAIRGMVGSRRRNMGVSYLEPLIDALVHSQDIAIPLGRPLDLPPDAAAVAATRAWTMRWPPPFPAVRALKGLRLTATDIAWSVGEGPEVRGPMAALLLLISGRTVVLDRLSGEGATEAAARLAAPVST
jgi:uncharacterized protein (TIGR03083 family)